ncbi:hypothetical protein OH76DRAFT_218087 [Lentinus brumalis]|uniref:Uncharacterized protein n=1 Tax=Lentinus brumalis TaxID=2498619 RepID=A0A371CM90_9APHY|nr:hypothetical protein OH76DRAFT_218087 [Polyporus brumalis]
MCTIECPAQSGEWKRAGGPDGEWKRVGGPEGSGREEKDLRGPEGTSPGPPGARAPPRYGPTKVPSYHHPSDHRTGSVCLPVHTPRRRRLIIASLVLHASTVSSCCTIPPSISARAVPVVC